MKRNSRLTKMFFAMIIAMGVAACGGGDEKQGDPSPVVEMKTSMGLIKIELNRKDSPITVDNFLHYVEEEHYDNTIFHRVVSDLMIQGGGFEKGENPTEKETEEPISNEAKVNGLKNEIYTIAMARTQTSNSATSQFFINVTDNRSVYDPGGFSPDGYAVFGRVIDGTEVVDKIKAVPVGTKSLKARNGRDLVSVSYEDVPEKQVVIESVRLVTKSDEKK